MLTTSTLINSGIRKNGYLPYSPSAISQEVVFFLVATLAWQAQEIPDDSVRLSPEECRSIVGLAKGHLVGRALS